MVEEKVHLSAIHRKDFPILFREVNGKPLVYFDNAASTHMPKQVLDRMIHYVHHQHSNVHRGIHTLSQEATRDYEGVRDIILSYLGASAERYSCIYTKGTTESINLVAHGLSKVYLNKNSVVLISEMEHHANLVPWQMHAQDVGFSIKKIPITDSGELDLEAYETLLSLGADLVCVNHVSNALGTVNPISVICEMAQKHGALVMLDGAQSVSHLDFRLDDFQPDFFAFSAHKLFGPTGVGALVAKNEWLEKMPPYQGGGDMIERVSFEGTTFNTVPHKFEAGTPAIAQVICMGEALSYIQSIGKVEIAQAEHELHVVLENELRALDKVKIIGTSESKIAVSSFVVDGIHPHDIGTFLDQDGIAIRVGHHCAQPIMQRFGIPATNRASLAFYNTFEEVHTFIASLKETITMLS